MTPLLTAGIGKHSAVTVGSWCFVTACYGIIRSVRSHVMVSRGQGTHDVTLGCDVMSMCDRLLATALVARRRRDGGRARIVRLGHSLKGRAEETTGPPPGLSVNSRAGSHQVTLDRQRIASGAGQWSSSMKRYREASIRCVWGGEMIRRSGVESCLLLS